MVQTFSRIKTEERNQEQQVPGIVCARCGLYVADRQVTVCPRCNSSLLPLTGCAGNCFTCKRNGTFIKQSSGRKI